nr:MAG TPA: metallophosphatase domain protein [Caudoviricetes sp.]
MTESANFAPPFVKVFGNHDFIMSTRGGWALACIGTCARIPHMPRVVNIHHTQVL